MDSTAAIDIALKCLDDDHRHGILARQIQVLLNRDWEVRISHVYREANFAADFLANRGHLVDFGTHRFNVCDPELGRWLLYDIMGIAHDRSIISLMS
ncbi:unnamed protein product [Linum tenue]|uniref:RNase H type-1 domain-containing protein n=1 Tax=Linum tenue TaxID=586396 RepID=A0AAV0PPV8_9ROSI|nr:unnamed protein product [Linum tenue]